ncbi:hypothetical protein FE257_002244 [Aspergillus nanangensis]|uniref:SAP domain-containing protein n=1 Tax=Aspergillus nanangensis TaxID=2582783 RepID=A0AAD4GP84_ASPNN|nr:hypothetical protein FE257_002244 [Aspergillus nanangensis]
MRLTPPVLQHACAYPWLQSLKTAQLQRIAQATGIQSSGPKAPLIQRLASELAQCEYRPDDHGSKTTTLSILSIDMGIRNLAFAHLLVPQSSSPAVGGKRSSSSTPPHSPLITTSPISPTLNAWRRLAISDLHLVPPSFSSSTANDNPNNPSTIPRNLPDLVPTSKETFAPALYAQLAYDLLTSLLDTYRPTHVLIERQRFRSGGGSAVQEWTLRVGVFEGMLYAVLYALQQERVRRGAGLHSSSSLSPSPIVVGIEPQRVARYWGDGLSLSHSPSQSEDGEKRGKKKATSSREGKRIKIDLVGRWLDSAAGVPSKVLVGEDPDLHGWVDGYLQRWKGAGKRTKRTTAGPEIGKLDDLADCLLQGVTWLEWQKMRDRISREGIHALDNC